MTQTPATLAPPARYADGRFGPGNPGRRPGSRNRASHRVAVSLLEHFEAHQGGVLDRLAAHNSVAYMTFLTRLLPTLLPRQASPPPAIVEEASDAEVAARLSRVLAIVQENRDLDERSRLIELEAVLVGE